MAKKQTMAPEEEPRQPRLSENMTDMILRADAVQRFGRKLLDGTELAEIPNTPETRDTAEKAIEAVDEHKRAYLKMSAEVRGMYFVWLKHNNPLSGQWQKYCATRFPNIPARTIRYCMARYLAATGQKRPKELGSDIEPEDVESEELVDAMMDPAASAAERLPRKELLHKLELQSKQLERGKRQLEEARAKLEASQDNAIPANSQAAHLVVDVIRLEFWKWVGKWKLSIGPNGKSWDRSISGVIEHQSLYQELQQKMLDLWIDVIGPLFDETGLGEKQDEDGNIIK